MPDWLLFWGSYSTWSIKLQKEHHTIADVSRRRPCRWPYCTGWRRV